MQFLNSHIDIVVKEFIYYNSIIESLKLSYGLLILVCQPKIFNSQPPLLKILAGATASQCLSMHCTLLQWQVSQAFRKLETETAKERTDLLILFSLDC